MRRPSSRKSEHEGRWVGLLALLLLVCVAATGVLWAENALIFAAGDETVIEIVPSGGAVLSDLNAVFHGAQAAAADAPPAQAGEPAEAPAPPDGGDEDTESGDGGAAAQETEADAETNADQEEDAGGTEVSIRAAAIRSAAPVSRAAVGAWTQDETQVWSAETAVEIFRVSYENDEGVVTAAGNDGGKLVAPGTEGKYTFWLKNGGTTTARYTMEMEAYLSPEEAALPVQVRVADSDGTYLTGGDGQWVDVLELNGVYDAAGLASGGRAQYTLEWQWPFEQGEDEYDTTLGNWAEREDLTLTVVIKTVAEANTPSDNGAQVLPGTITIVPPNGGEDTPPDGGTQPLPGDDPTIPPDGGGSTPPDTDDTTASGGSPKTGDDFNLALYAALMLVSAAGLAFLLLFGIRKRKHEEEDHVQTEKPETKG